MRLLSLVPAALLLAASTLACHAGSINATATITDTPDASLAGVTDYSITLNNPSNTTDGIATFWFGFVPGADLLSATPTNIGSPAGWTEILTDASGGSAIQWDTSTKLAPGSSLSGFTFDSTETPAELFSANGTGDGSADPQLTAFVFADGPLIGDGREFVVTPGTAVTPEPSTLALFGTGILGLAGIARRKFLNA